MTEQKHGESKVYGKWKYDDRLESCPFCGAPAVIFTINRPDLGKGCVSYQVMCGAHFTVDCFYPETGRYDTENEAIRTWNNRSNGEKLWEYVPPNEHEEVGFWKENQNEKERQ